MLASTTWLLGLVVMEQISIGRESCDISTCDLSPDGNPEKYGRPMKSVIRGVDFTKYELSAIIQSVQWSRNG